MNGSLAVGWCTVILGVSPSSRFLYRGSQKNGWLVVLVGGWACSETVSGYRIALLFWWVLTTTTIDWPLAAICKYFGGCSPSNTRKWRQWYAISKYPSYHPSQGCPGTEKITPNQYWTSTNSTVGMLQKPEWSTFWDDLLPACVGEFWCDFLVRASDDGATIALENESQFQYARLSVIKHPTIKHQKYRAAFAYQMAESVYHNSFLIKIITSQWR